MSGAPDAADLLSKLPYPVARAAAVAFDESRTPQVRLWNVPHALYQTLRMLTLPVVAQYLDAPVETKDMPSQKAVASLGRMIGELRHPFLPSWIALLDALAKRVTGATVNLEPCLPLREVVERLKAEAAPVSEARYAPPACGKVEPPHRAIYGLRNGLAHQGAMPEDQESLRLLGAYLPLLAQVLRAAAPLADCLLVVREGRFDGERTMVRRYRGPEAPAPSPVGDDDEELVDALEESGVILRLPDGRALGLSPLLAVTAGPVVGLYDGHYAALTTGTDGRPGALRHLVYLGEGNQRWTDEEGFDRLIARLEARQVQWQIDKEKLAPWSVSECVRFRTVEMTLRPLEGIKYFPECHVERPDLRRWVDGWIAESDDVVAALREGKPSRRIYRSGFVLVGAAGAGKTAWSLHLAERLLGEGVPPEAGEDAARDGRNLVLLLRGDQFPERAERLDRLLPTMLEALGLRDKDYASFGDLLGHLHKKWPEDVRPDRRLVVILDAVNEARAPERLLREALDLVAAAGKFPWSKVVLTLREEFLDVVCRRSHAMEANPFTGVAQFLYRPPAEEEGSRPGEPSNPVVRLQRLSIEEAGDAYRRYAARGLVDRPGCRTPWEELGVEVRELLRTPLLLYVFHRAYSGKDGGAMGSRPALFRAYTDVLLGDHPALEHACAAVIAHLVQTKRAVVGAEEAAEIVARWWAGANVGEARVALTPVEDLVHAGLLRRLPRAEGEGFVFVFECVLEYLVYRLWRKEDDALSMGFLRARVDEGVAGDAPAFWWHAFYFVFERLVAEGRAEDWPELLNERSPAPLDAVAARVWGEAASTCGLPSDAPAEALLATPPGRVVTAFARRGTAEAAMTLSSLHGGLITTRRPEWSALVFGHAAAVRRELVLKGHAELREDLASAYNSLGDVLRVLGRHAEAVAACERARAMYVELMKGKRRRELRNGLAMVDNNLGAALTNLGRHADAVAAYDRARAIYVELVKGEGRRALRYALGQVDNNLGGALYHLGRQAEAVLAFEQARAIYAEMVEEEGRRELRKDLAMVDSNFAIVLGHLGRHGEAVAAYGRARAIYVELVEGEGRHELRQDLAKVDYGLGAGLTDLGRYAEAVTACERARATYAQLVERDGRRELRSRLAESDIFLGDALAALGRHAEAVAAYGRSRAIYVALVEANGRQELRNWLARVDNILGNALSRLGRHAEAVAALERARAIRAELVEVEGRQELRDVLALVDHNLGIALRELGRYGEAVAAFERARAIYAELVEGEGRRRILPALYETLLDLLLAVGRSADHAARGPAITADVLAVARTFRQEGYSDIPAPWLAELADVTELAAKTQFVTEEERAELVKLAAEMRSCGR